MIYNDGDRMSALKRKLDTAPGEVDYRRINLQIPSELKASSVKKIAINPLYPRIQAVVLDDGNLYLFNSKFSCYRETP